MADSIKRILLLMDNASSHVLPGSDSTELHGLKCISLSNITIVFLPPNTTSVIQPLDAGIIAAFKQRYRAELLRWYVQQFDSDSTRDLSKQLPDIRQAIIWSAQVWQDISEQTIRNCWRKVQILPPTWSADINNLDERERTRQNEAIADLSSLISSLNLGSDALEPEEYEAFPGEDEVGDNYLWQSAQDINALPQLFCIVSTLTMQVEQVMTDEELVAFVTASNQPSADQEMEAADSNETEAEAEVLIPCLSEAQGQLMGLARLVGDEPSFSAADEMFLNRLSSKLSKINVSRLHRRQQQSITSFFAPRPASD